MSSQSIGAPALTFTFSSQSLRVITIDGEPWFVASDVCDALDHSDTSKAVSRLDDDEKLIRTMFASGQNREVLVINESGLYSLILTSRKPEAKKFKKWVTSEVLPAIRKTGRYEAPTATTAPDAAAVEYISANDQANIRQIIWLISKPFQYERSVSNAIWLYLRNTLQWPSPQPFTVEQLPRIAQELGRIQNICYQVNEIVCDFEKQAIKRMFRAGEPCDLVIPYLQKQADLRISEVKEFYSKLPTYITNDLNAITMRKPHHGYLKHSSQEELDFFKA